MRIEIEIPKEFECDYNVDKFKDFFGRAIGSIDFMHGVCGRYEKETAQMLKKAFAESKVAYDVEAVVAELEAREKSYRTASKKKSMEFPQKMYYTGIMRGYEYSREVVQNGGKE